VTDFRTRDLRDTPFIAVLLLAAGGVAYSAYEPTHWLRGIEVVALAMLLGATLRALLTERQAGLLAIRHRGFDVSCYFVLGAGIVGIGLLLPHG
jgi:hypothetical protein